MAWPTSWTCSPLAAATEASEREEVTHAARRAAQLVAASSDAPQSYAAAKAYGGEEWRNALLRALVGWDQAHDIMTTR